jgi:Ca2+-binding RTX toxin-like protein
MAVLDARAARTAFDMFDIFTRPAKNIESSSTLYAYDTASDTVRAPRPEGFALLGRGITVDSNDHPTGGIITQARIDIDNNGAIDVTISSFTASLRTMVGGDNPFWRSMLAGNDVIYGPSTHGGVVFGDFRVSTGNVTAGNDSMSGAGPNLMLIGDADTTGRGTFNGGNDIIVATSIRGTSTIIGDVHRSYLTDFHGGDDRLAGSDTRGDLIVGDLRLVGSDAVCGDDIINGRGGNDEIYGDTQAARFHEGGFGVNHTIDFGNDRINGGAGNDTIFGDGFGADAGSTGGQDVIEGGTGDDTMTGGLGADRFIFRADADHDVVTDFEDDIDQLEISASYGFANADEVADAATADGNDAVINLSPDDTIRLTGFLAAHTINDLRDDIIIF